MRRLLDIICCTNYFIIPLLLGTREFCTKQAIPQTQHINFLKHVQLRFSEEVTKRCSGNFFPHKMDSKIPTTESSFKEKLYNDAYNSTKKNSTVRDRLQILLLILSVFKQIN